ncbi:MAG: sensor histidine kinase [Nocardioides sp.]
MHPLVVRHWQDVAIAVVVAGAATLEVLLPLTSVMGEGSRSVSLSVALVLCAALVFRRAYPLAVATVVLLTWPVVYTLTPVLVLFWGQFVPIVVALYSVARHGSTRHGVYGGLLGAAGLLFFDLRVPELDSAEEIVFHWMVCTVAWSLGQFVRSYEASAHAQSRRAALAETSSREQALQAVVDERARIARELHDIVAHSVSVMVVQAGAAQKALDDPEFVGEALNSIRTTGTGALQEMRRVVALIRDEDDVASLEPQPSLESLEQLIAKMDVPTLLLVEGVERTPEAGVGLSAYRIVQEALTNVRRHAAASSVSVTVRYLSASLEIEVADDGRGTAHAIGGNGLIGMRERAAMCGGTVSVSTAPGEGFRVVVELPMTPVTV